MVIVEIAGGEGSKRLIVQAVRRRLAGFDDVAFEQFEFYFACYVFLGYINECLDCFTKWCEPFSFVYDLSKFISKIFLNLICSTVENELFKLVMCFHKDCSTRSLVNTT